MKRKANGHFAEVSPAERLWPKVVKTNTCWVWTGDTNGAYGNFWFKQRKYKTHRIAWMLAYGPIPDGALVLHSCDIPLCVRPSHLFLGDKRLNALDCVWKRRNGERTRPSRKPRGERHGNRKLTDEGVREIRSMLNDGGS